MKTNQSLSHVSQHLENACKAMLVEDESLVRRAEIASVEIELIGQEEIHDLPERIRAEFTYLLEMAANEFTIDTAVEFASKLLSLLLSCEVENFRTRPESH